MNSGTRQKLNVVDLIYRKGSLARADLAAAFALSPPTISAIVKDLLARGIITEAEYGESQGGRRPALLAMEPDVAAAIGIEISYRGVTAAAVRIDGRILARHAAAEPAVRGTRDILEAAAAAVTALLPAVAPRRLAGVGIGVSGIVRENNFVSQSHPGAEAWDDLPLADWIERRSGERPFVFNDAAAAALGAQRCGGHTGVANLAYLHMGRGIAAGVVIDGRIYQGATGNAGEIGHTAVEPDGPICYCGNRGCLESFASPAAIVRQYTDALGRNGSLPPAAGTGIADVFAAAEAGDRCAATVLDEAGGRLGRAGANLVNLLNPAMLVLGGLLIDARGPLVPALMRVLEARILPALRDTVRIEVSRLGGDACALGAAAAVFDRFVEQGSFLITRRKAKGERT